MASPSLTQCSMIMGTTWTSGSLAWLRVILVSLKPNYNFWGMIPHEGQGSLQPLHMEMVNFT